MGTATPEELAGFELFLNTVLSAPERAQELVKERPTLLECRNNTAETVLRWLAVENLPKEIRVVHSLGATIPDFALVHALQAGNEETVDLLLSLGAGFGQVDPLASIGDATWNLSEEKKRSLRSCLTKYGYG